SSAKSPTPPPTSAPIGLPPGKTPANRNSPTNRSSCGFSAPWSASPLLLLSLVPAKLCSWPPVPKSNSSSANSPRPNSISTSKGHFSLIASCHSRRNIQSPLIGTKSTPATAPATSRNFSSSTNGPPPSCASRKTTPSSRKTPRQRSTSKASFTPSLLSRPESCFSANKTWPQISQHSATFSTTAPNRGPVRKSNSSLTPS